ncbi:hypothetical protein [Pseudonocardia sp. KRD291]|uniref:hypothetical protein n=1 Tax=Pseudonocardia sp. KRD291 TaxID=2792007 RepID=UPI001C49DBFC|nr:hypothetical protein [Pseudonocardia sp. KRD291]MBW0100993.1 hypothetical protein [Pseudonocardia sp. KRD291]
MLTSLDDSLWHQLPTTFDHVGTSDPRFFDRYWFACYAPYGDTAIQVTMGAYRNMNVLDGGVIVVHRGRQYNVRVSRSLGHEVDPVCGPLTVRPTVPLQEFRLTIAPGEHGVSGELIWTGVLPPAEERPHFARTRGRVTENYRRFDQIGTVRGRLEVGGETVEVADWWACRDHSWGVRPRMGVREPVTGPKPDLAQKGFAMAFLFFATDAVAGHVLFDRRGDDPGYVTGDLAWRDGSRLVQEVSGTDLDVSLHPDTRRFTDCALGATLSDGEEVTFRCTALGSSIAMQGLGYSGGWSDRGGLGVWRDARLEHDVWDVSHPSTIRYPDGTENEHWHRIQPVAVELVGAGPVSRGQGSMTLILSGRLPWLGLS